MKHHCLAMTVKEEDLMKVVMTFRQLYADGEIGQETDLYIFETKKAGRRFFRRKRKKG